MTEMKPRLIQVFSDEEADDIMAYLLTKEIEYHKPYKRFNKVVKVPRGQASYTLSEDCLLYTSPSPRDS